MFFKRKVKKVKNKMAYAQVMAIGFFVIIAYFNMGMN